jgi:hypothetical protein
LQAEASAHTPNPRWGFCSIILADGDGTGFGALYAPMNDNDDTHLHGTYASHSDMDAAFFARMRIAIAARLESASIGVVTTPGTKNPRYVPTELPPLASSLSDRDFA